MATPRALFDDQENTWNEIFGSVREHESLCFYLAQGATNADVDIFETDWNSHNVIKQKLDKMFDVTFDHMVNTISDSNAKLKATKNWLKSTSITTNFTFDESQTREIDNATKRYGHPTHFTDALTVVGTMACFGRSLLKDIKEYEDENIKFDDDEEPSTYLSTTNSSPSRAKVKMLNEAMRGTDDDNPFAPNTGTVTHRNLNGKELESVARMLTDVNIMGWMTTMVQEKITAIETLWASLFECVPTTWVEVLVTEGHIDNTIFTSPNDIQGKRIADNISKADIDADGILTLVDNPSIVTPGELVGYATNIETISDDLVLKMTKSTELTSKKMEPVLSSIADNITETAIIPINRKYISKILSDISRLEFPDLASSATDMTVPTYLREHPIVTDMHCYQKWVLKVFERLPLLYRNHLFCRYYKTPDGETGDLFNYIQQATAIQILQGIKAGWIEKHRALLINNINDSTSNPYKVYALLKSIADAYIGPEKVITTGLNKLNDGLTQSMLNSSWEYFSQLSAPIKAHHDLLLDFSKMTTRTTPYPVQPLSAILTQIADRMYDISDMKTSGGNTNFLAHKMREELQQALQKLVDDKDKTPITWSAIEKLAMDKLKPIDAYEPPTLPALESYPGAPAPEVDNGLKAFGADAEANPTYNMGGGSGAFIPSRSFPATRAPRGKGKGGKGRGKGKGGWKGKGKGGKGGKNGKGGKGGKGKGGKGGRGDTATAETDNWWKDATCWLCGEKGHIAPNCPNRGDGEGASKKRKVDADAAQAWYDPTNYNPMTGVRIGEAGHPGPWAILAIIFVMIQGAMGDFIKIQGAMGDYVRIGEANHPGPVKYMHPCCGLDAWHHAFPEDELIWAADKDPIARKVIASQNPYATILGDCYDIIKEQVPTEPIDIYLIGTDCRPWSIYGNQSGDADPRADMYTYHWNLIEMMEPQYRPRIVLTEQSSEVQHTKAQRDMVNRGRELGYVAKEYMVNSRMANSIQQRFRLFTLFVIDGTYARIGHVKLGDLPEITTTVRTALKTPLWERPQSTLTPITEFQQAEVWYRNPLSKGLKLLYTGKDPNERNTKVHSPDGASVALTCPFDDSNVPNFPAGRYLIGDYAVAPLFSEVCEFGGYNFNVMTKIGEEHGYKEAMKFMGQSIDIPTLVYLGSAMRAHLAHDDQVIASITDESDRHLALNRQATLSTNASAIDIAMAATSERNPLADSGCNMSIYSMYWASMMIVGPASQCNVKVSGFNRAKMNFTSTANVTIPLLTTDNEPYYLHDDDALMANDSVDLMGTIVSVSRVARRNGCEFVFGDRQGSIKTQDGKTIPLLYSNGLYFLRVDTRTLPCLSKEIRTAAATPRDLYTDKPVDLEKVDQRTFDNYAQVTYVDESGISPTSRDQRQFDGSLDMILAKTCLPPHKIRAADKAEIPGFRIKGNKTLTGQARDYYQNIHDLSIMRKTPSKSQVQEIQESTPGGLSGDSHGPYAIPTVGGNQTAIDFMDSCTGHMWTFLVPTPKDYCVVNCLNAIYSELNSLAVSLRFVRFDCTPEFGYGPTASQTVKQWFDERNVSLYHTVEYYKNQFEVERYHQILTGMQLQAMVRGGAPESWWGFARRAMTVVHNHSPQIRSSRYMQKTATPRHALTQGSELMDASFMHVLFCYAVIYNEHHMHLKGLRRRGIAAIFVGYAHPYTRSWYFVVPGEKTIHHTRHVSWYDHICPFVDGSAIYQDGVVSWRMPLQRFINPLGTGPVINQRLNPLHDAGHPKTHQKNPFDQNYQFLSRDRGENLGRNGAQPADRRGAFPGTDHTSTLDRMIDANVPVIIQQENPKRGDSQDRYEKYKGAKTMRELIDFGATRGDIRWDLDRGFVKLANPVMQSALGDALRAAKAETNDLRDAGYHMNHSQSIDYAFDSDCPDRLLASICQATDMQRLTERDMVPHMELRDTDNLVTEFLQEVQDGASAKPSGDDTGGQVESFTATKAPHDAESDMSLAASANDREGSKGAAPTMTGGDLTGEGTQEPAGEGTREPEGIGTSQRPAGEGTQGPVGNGKSRKPEEAQILKTEVHAQ